MPNKDEEEVQATANWGASALSPDTPPPPLPPPPPYRPTLALNASHPCSPQGSGGILGEEHSDDGTGVRLCELLQAGGVSVRPLGKHLAISLPSLPLRLWDTHTTQTTHIVHLEQTRPPAPPPPPSPPVEPQTKPLTPVWQPPRPHSPMRHWSSWSLDRPDAVVTPYDTPPDRYLPIRPQPPNYSCQSSPGHYSSRRAPGPHCESCCGRDEAELSELDSLYQASLQAGRTGTVPSHKIFSKRMHFV